MKKVFLFVVIALLISLSILVYTQHIDVLLRHTPAPLIATQEIFTLQNLLDSTDSLDCTLKDNIGAISSLSVKTKSGMVYGTYVSNPSGAVDETTSYFLVKDQNLYYWTNKGQQGYVTSLNAEHIDIRQTGGLIAPPLEKSLSYSCVPLEENSLELFIVPSTVSFIDVPVISLPEVPNTVSALCATCDTVEDDAGRNQCRIHFKCI